MRIAIASDDGKTVACHTGRYAYWLVYEIAGGRARRIDCRPNPVVAMPCGAYADAELPPVSYALEPRDVEINAIADCRVLVTGTLGSRLLLDLAGSGIEPYLCADNSAEAAAEQFAAGRLARADGGPVAARPDLPA